MAAGSVGPVGSTGRRGWLVAATLAYVGLVAYATLTPSPEGWGPETVIGRALDWLGRHGVPRAYDLAEAGANVAMFVPFGILAWLWLRRWWAAVLLGVLATCLIEVSQWAFLPSRYPSLQDVAMNSLGAAVGVLLAKVFAGLRQPAATRDGSRTNG